MTHLSNLLNLWRIRRAQQPRSDSVSFEAFCNERTTASNNYPVTRESSLCNSFEESPQHEVDEYVRFSHDDDINTSCSRPSLATTLLAIMLLAVFFILPIIYLLHCFGVINLQQEMLTDWHIQQHIKDMEHYSPSSIVHKELSQSQDAFENVLQKIPNIQTKTNDLPPPPKPDYNQCRILTDDKRFDCYPQDGANAAKCEARGCCWIPRKGRFLKRNKINKGNVPLDVPYCFYPANYIGYDYVNITTTAFGLTAFMKRRYKSPYPGDVNTVKMTVKYETKDRLHIKFTDPSHTRFEPPYPEVPIVDRAASNLSYIVDVGIKISGFKIRRKSDNVTIFDADTFGNMVFADQLLQFSAKLPPSYIYGLGEHRTNLQLSANWQRLTMFNRDGPPTENMNLYGSHPFALVLEPSGKSYGIFLLNSNAMDVILQPTPAITYRPIGGVFDFYFFLGPTPSDVVKQYLEIIGLPAMPPYWGLGFHLCRFGYKTLNETRKVLQRNLDAGIPVDTQWNDLDYMNNSNDFTYDHVNYRGLPDFVKELHSKGMHYIPLVDPGVSASEKPGSYPPFDKGVEMDIFVKNSSGQLFIGKVWNRASTVWPDFTHPSTVDYWILMLRNMHESFEFDGAWIDMNEPANFLSGSFNGCPNSSLENPPYLPAVDGGQLNHKTMCMTAQHFAGLHYNVHNLYGFTEAIVTSFAMAEIRGKRPMVISRSTFPGHGHYAGHWSGDIASAWHDMKFTVPQLLSFSMFGIPLMGADICGFNQNTTAPLCNRWMQLGAFYPFSRNHNTDNGIDQDPAALGSLVIASSKKALAVRYSLLPYLYTLFWAAHVNGDTVARPLFFEFVNDNQTYNIDTQFLWGSSVMVIPVLEENSVFVSAYIPAGVWYDYYTRTALNSEGENFNISAPLDTIPVLVRGGCVIPQQSALMTTTESRKSKIQLLAASDLHNQGVGQFYWDDGDSLNSVEEKRYSLFNFTLKQGELQSLPVWLGSETPPNLGLVTVLGVISPVSEVTVNQVAQGFRYDTIHKYLQIDNLDINFKVPVTVAWK